MRESNMNISVWRKWAIVWMVSVLSGFQLRAADPVVIPANTEPLTIEGNRFVTLCIMIRTTPWEVSRDVKLHPRDEVDWHTLKECGPCGRLSPRITRTVVLHGDSR